MARARHGFTLIELLIVTVLLGILASLAVTRVSVARQRAYLGAMQSDLRNLVTAQEAYFDDHEQAYAPRVRDLGARFQSSPGVVLRVTNVTQRGWTATAEHDASSVVCTLSVEGGASSSAVCASAGSAGK